MFCTLDQRLSSLVTGAWSANIFSMRKRLLNPYFQNLQAPFWFFLTFSLNKCWWKTHFYFANSFVEDTLLFRLALLLKGMLRQPQPPSPPPLTTGDCHESPLLAVGPPHKEEQFNRSEIFKTQLEDSLENETSNPSFAVSLR